MTAQTRNTFYWQIWLSNTFQFILLFIKIINRIFVYSVYLKKHIWCVLGDIVNATIQVVPKTFAISANYLLTTVNSPVYPSRLTSPSNSTPSLSVFTIDLYCSYWWDITAIISQMFEHLIQSRLIKFDIRDGDNCNIIPNAIQFEQYIRNIMYQCWKPLFSRAHTCS